MRDLLIDSTAELISFYVYWALVGGFALSGFVWETLGIMSLLSNDKVVRL